MSSSSESKTPTMLIIMDGVGLAPAGPHNAVTEANTPFLDKLFAEAPNSELRTDGTFVGLPDGQMGNSEVGHMTIGSGRIILQSLDQISKDLNSGAFEQISEAKSFLAASENAPTTHLVGLVSDGGVHSHIDHMIDVARLLDRLGRKTVIHCILDGRDTSPTSGAGFVTKVQDETAALPNVTVATVIGRFYGMDRDNRWERMDDAWQLWTGGKGERAADLSGAIRAHYETDTTDEFMPAIIDERSSDAATLSDGDAVLICNFRADRARQIIDLLLQNELGEKLAPVRSFSAIATMTEYKSDFDPYVHVIYPNVDYKNTLGEILSNAGRTQLRISETEKYAHVTYYLNCGREAPYDNETRILIDSPKEVATYDLKPQMSLPEVTAELTKQIGEGGFDFITLNIANGDQVGHTGVREAAIDAMECVDQALSEISTALEAAGGEAIIIADHGNVEELMIDGAVSTAHSTNPVPCIYLGKRDIALASGGLADVAPTLLELMGMDIPSEMTGRSLIR